MESLKIAANVRRKWKCYSQPKRRTLCSFPRTLTDTYKPQTLDDARWCGLEKQRKILANLAANPRMGSVVLLEGPPGVGKSSLAFCYARAAKSEVFHIYVAASEHRHIARGGAAVRLRAYDAKIHCLIVDEISEASNAFQLACLSKFDGTAAMNCVTVMTCNDASKLEPKFLSRCIRPPVCNAYGVASVFKISNAIHLAADALTVRQSPIGRA